MRIRLAKICTIGGLMDIFTHLFFSYLINFGIGSLNYNEYAMVFGIALGMLPDFDILLYPVGRKYSGAKHRGISHSILFIFIATVILSAIFAPILHVDYLVLFLIGIVSGLGHICLDVLTTIGIPVFWPFSKRELCLGLERPINVYFMGISVFFIFFLFHLRNIKFDYQIYLQIINLLVIAIILYYLVKLMIKYYLQVKTSTTGFMIHALPTAGLFKWYLVGKKDTGGVLRIKYCRCKLIENMTTKPKFKYFSCNHSESLQPPLDSKEKVKTYSYNLKEVRSFIRKFKYPLADVTAIPAPNKFQWTIFWYPLELLTLNRATAIRVDLDTTGKYRTKYSPLRKQTNFDQNL